MICKGSADFLLLLRLQHSVRLTTSDNLICTDKVYIGAGSGSNPDEYKWRGQIDEVAYWDVALSEADVRLLYNDGQGLDLAQFM